MPIVTAQDLRDHVELAIQVELSTIPPYLYALHSIEDQASDAALLIRSIVVEEMLHAALATNLLLGVGGEPRFDTTDWMPSYPEPLPHHTPPLVLGLEPASPELVRNVFMAIEQPEVHGAPPEADAFETLGQFYHAIELALTHLAGTSDLFAHPRLSRQMGDPTYYAPVTFDAEDSGGLVAVTDLGSAFQAIEIIVHQGEGLSTERWADPLHQELTHYFKLLDIAEGRSPLGAVRPLPRNPKAADFPPDVRQVADLFNAVYRYTYLVMHRIFQGGPGQAELIGSLYGCMSGILSPIAQHLVRQETPAGLAAPTFEIHEFGPDPDAELLALATDAAATWPEIAAPAAAIQAMCGGA